jgi:hypothetical protein
LFRAEIRRGRDKPPRREPAQGSFRPWDRRSSIPRCPPGYTLGVSLSGPFLGPANQ